MRNLIPHLTLAILVTLSGCKGSAFTKNQNSNNTDNSSNPTTNETTTVINNTTSGSELADCLLFRFPDGAGKNLWKPSAESSQNPGAVVILFNDDLRDIFKSVELTVASTENTNEFQEFCFINQPDPFTNPFNDNSLPRQTWRCSQHGSAYTGEMRVTVREGIVCDIVIPTPGERVD